MKRIALAVAVLTLSTIASAAATARTTERDPSGQRACLQTAREVRVAAVNAAHEAYLVALAACGVDKDCRKAAAADYQVERGIANQQYSDDIDTCVAPR